MKEICSRVYKWIILTILKTSTRKDILTTANYIWMKEDLGNLSPTVNVVVNDIDIDIENE